MNASVLPIKAAFSVYYTRGYCIAAVVFDVNVSSMSAPTYIDLIKQCEQSH